MLAAIRTLTLLVMLAPIAALAQAAPPELSDTPGMFKAMVEAFQNGNIPLAVGMMALILAALVGLANAVLLKATAVPDETRKKILPWLVAAGGMLTMFGMTLIGGAGWFASIVTGLLTSAAAVGFWELVLKRVVGALSRKQPEPKSN